MDVESKKEFARLNAWREIIVARGSFAKERRSGFICGHGLGVMFAGKGDQYTQHNFTGLFFPVGTWPYFDEPENFDPIDGLGPLKYPAPHTKDTPHGAVVTAAGPPYVEAWKAGGCMVCGKADRDGRGYSHQACCYASDARAWEQWSRECERAMDGSGTPRVKDAAGNVLIDATVNIPRATLQRVAEFLNAWQPLGGESVEREREAVTLTGMLKAVLWPAKEGR